jgi:Multicopper oxidase
VFEPECILFWRVVSSSRDPLSLVIGCRLAESLKDAETGIPAPFFPIVMAFDWDSVVNGILAEDNQYEFIQGETVLFRVVSAGVEPAITLYFNESSAPEFLILSEDGFPVPELATVDEVDISAGSRVEVMVKFDEPGTYQLRRKPWNLEITGVEACNASFGIPLPTCISYDLDKPIGTITVLAAEIPVDAELPTEVPEMHQHFKDMEEMPVANYRTVVFQQKPGFPIFQIPYEGPFVPPGVGFGINDRLLTPHYSHGDIIAGTCEEWTVVNDPPFSSHSFHLHTNPFLVTHENGIPVDKPFWRDTYEINGYNMTIKTCFNRLEPGDFVMAHCHQLVHQDIGVRNLEKCSAAVVKQRKSHQILYTCSCQRWLGDSKSLAGMAIAVVMVTQISRWLTTPLLLMRVMWRFSKTGHLKRALMKKFRLNAAALGKVPTS